MLLKWFLLLIGMVHMFAIFLLILLIAVSAQKCLIEGPSI